MNIERAAASKGMTKEVLLKSLISNRQEWSGEGPCFENSLPWFADGSKRSDLQLGGGSEVQILASRSPLEPILVFFLFRDHETELCARVNMSKKLTQTVKLL